MPQIAIVPPRPQVVRNRRASDRAPEMPDLELVPDEFRTDAMAPGTHSIAFSVSGHEHPVDPERLTVTCAVCKAALEAADRAETIKEVVVEIAPETWVALDGAGGRIGLRPPAYAAQVLAEWAAARR